MIDDQTISEVQESGGAIAIYVEPSESTPLDVLRPISCTNEDSTE